MDISWNVTFGPEIWVILLIALILTVLFLVQGRYDFAAIVVSVLSIILFLPLTPLILLGDTAFFAIIGKREYAMVTGVLSVVSFVVLMLL